MSKSLLERAAFPLVPIVEAMDSALQGREFLPGSSGMIGGEPVQQAPGPHSNEGGSPTRTGRLVAEDLAGEVFGRLTVLRRDGTSPYGAAAWMCQCQCGKRHRVIGSSLRSGSARSCGCLREDTTKARRRTHGATAGGRGTRTYRIWAEIKARCENPNNASFPTHGGRGITMDPRWRDYSEFTKDMGEAPPGKTLGRFDVSGPYDKANCRWGEKARARPRVADATLKNVRSDYLAGGLTQKEIAKRYGLSPSKVCVIVSDLKPATG